MNRSPGFHRLGNRCVFALAPLLCAQTSLFNRFFRIISAIISWINDQAKNYRLTRSRATRRSSQHEYAHHFWDRGWLHSRRAIVAGHGIAVLMRGGEE